jgi:hypothetical protein
MVEWILEWILAFEDSNKEPKILCTYLIQQPLKVFQIGHHGLVELGALDLVWSHVGRVALGLRLQLRLGSRNALGEVGSRLGIGLNRSMSIRQCAN